MSALKLPLMLAAVAWAASAAAQPEQTASPGVAESDSRESQHPAAHGTSTSAAAQSEHAAGHGAAADDEHARMMAAMYGPLGIPITQTGSGTAWQPATSPMYGHMALKWGWTFMLHYLVFAGADLQRSEQGATEAFTTNWVMGMAQRWLWGGQLTGRAMLSLEAPLLGKDGYPLLLQTGETANGAPLVDRQHPHDLFMEVALKYNRAISKHLAFELYAAPVGEPALGPVAFPHRISAYGDPFAVLSHHWQDSTHILFGVLSAGLYTKFLKLEGSWFNGREPDENRYNFDLRVPDSYSVRLTVNPTENWSAQFSYGFLQEPEPLLAPGESLHRLTASILYNQRLASGGNWATAFVWGQNRGDHGASNSALVESNLQFGQNNLFGRAEFVLKSGHDFALPGEEAEAEFPVGALALGYIRNFGPWAGLVPGIGARAAVNAVPAGLEGRYGTRLPLGFAVFLRLRPVEMMAGMGHGAH